MKMKNYGIIGAFIFLALGFSGIAQKVNQVQKIVASDRANNDAFGQAVSVSGNYMVVGAPQEDHDASGLLAKGNAGSAYVFKKDVNGNWVELQKLVASDRNNSDNFGNAVAISGNYIVVGAVAEKENEVGQQTKTGAGSAYIFENDGADNWIQVKKIVASDRNNNDNFGFSVAVSGDHIVVGAYQEDEDASGTAFLSGAGSAYVFERIGGVWIQAQKIVSSDRNSADNFGYSVSISGNQLVVGAYQDDEDATGGAYFSGSGAAYVFEKGTEGTWGEIQKIVANDRAASDYFGASVGISGDRIIVGAYQEDENASGGGTLSNAGSAYIFEKNGSWGQVQKIVAADRGASDNFGYAVAIDNNHAIVSAYVDGGDLNNQNEAMFAGSAYVFDRKSNGTWSAGAKIVASDRATFDYFAYSVAISSTSVVTGAYFESENATGGQTKSGAGSAYVFEIEACLETTATIDTTICSAITINSETYSTTGTFTQTLTNAAGCDSILTIKVTKNTPSSSSLTATSCGSYKLNSQTYTTSGVYTQTVTGSNGCDSVITLNLTVNTPTSSSLTATSCGSYKLNNQTYTTTGVYTQTVTGSNGCDSVITLNLKVEEVNEEVVLSGETLTATESGATYKWLDCNNANAIISGETAQSFMPVEDGDYAVEITKGSCKAVSECMFVDIVLTSFTSSFDAVNTSVYPNPTSGNVKLIMADKHQAYIVNVFTQTGELVNTQEISTETELTLGTASGLYLVEVIDSNTGTVEVLKVMKK